MTEPPVRRFIGLALVLGLLLSRPAFWVGFVHDDFIHRAMLDGRVETLAREPHALYDFMPAGLDEEAMLEAGQLPWWAESGVSIRFFRPLSSLSLAADHWLFGDAVAPAHLQSVLMFLGLVVLVGRLYRMLLPARIAGMATVLYAVAGCHALPVAWIAARHVLLSAGLGLAVLIAHLRWREQGWRPGRGLALVALVFGMLTGESILGAAAFVGSYELIGRHGRATLRDRLVGLAPLVVLTAAYLVFYVAAGFGTRGTGAYIDPVGAPLEFIAAVAVRAPVLIGEMLAAVPSALYMAEPTTRPGLAIIGAAAALGLAVVVVRGWAEVPEQARRHLPWLVVGTLLAIVPACAGTLGGRLLVLPLVGSTALVASVLVVQWDRARQPGHRRAWLLIGPLALAHLVLGPLVRVGLGVSFVQSSAEERRIASDSELRCQTGSDVVFVAVADPGVVFYVPLAMLLADKPVDFASFNTLSMAPQDHRLTVVDAHGFTLKTLGERQVNPWESVYRSEPLPRGEVRRLHHVTIAVQESTPHGPTELRVEFDRPLGSSSLCFLQWEGGLIQPLTLPPPGESMELRHERGVMY